MNSSVLDDAEVIGPHMRAWRRYLSENAYRENAGVEVLFEALDAMPVAA